MEKYPHLHSGVADQCHFNVDSDQVFHLNANPYPDPTFHLNAGPDLVSDPAPHQSAATLRLLVYNGNPDPDPAFQANADPVPAPLMRIKICNPAAFS